jgi:hypothetical protein
MMKKRQTKKKEVFMPKDKGVLEQGPGDFKEKPEVPSWRGESGSSDAKGSEETGSVEYGR